MRVPGQLEPTLEFFGPFFQAHIGLRVVVSSRQVKQVLGKGVPRIFDESLSGMFDDAIADAGSELFIAHGGAAQADHDIVRRQQSIEKQVVDCGDQTPTSQVA